MLESLDAPVLDNCEFASASAVAPSPSPAPTTGHGPDFSQRDITAVVTRIRPISDGFTILELDGNRAATGTIPDGESLWVGVRYRFFGSWMVHSQYGAQFRFESFIVADQVTELGVTSFLQRGGAGLTRTEAAKAWRAYGPQAIDVLRTDIPRVVADGVLSQIKALDVSRKLALAMEFAPVKIALFELFSNIGFPRGVVNDAIKKWGHKAPTIIRRDPFRMLVAQFPGVGFKRADKLYTQLGGNPYRLKRQLLGAWHTMMTEGNGNTWDSIAVLERSVLGITKSIVDSDFERVLTLGLRSRWLLERKDQTDGDSRWITIASRGRDEQRLAYHVKRVMDHKAFWPAIPEDSNLTPHQREQLQKIINAPVGILAGGPGTGKTTCAAALLRELQKLDVRIAVAAPTGKASVRITEAMNEHGLGLKASTIHGLLGVADKRYGAGQAGGAFQFQHDEMNPLDVDVIICDEMSMVDCGIAASLFAAIPTGAIILLVGDSGQLPPVEHGAPLRDMIAAGVPTASLTEIHRNAGAIVRACHAIKDGKRFETSEKWNPEIGENLKLVPAETQDEQLSRVIACLHGAGQQGFSQAWDCQVLVATNDKSIISRVPLNTVLQPILNKNAATKPSDQKFCIGDKIICLKNTWMNLVAKNADASEEAVGNWRQTPSEVFVANGDMGRVLAADVNAAVVEFGAPKRIVKVVTKKKRGKIDEEGEASGGGDGNNSDFDLAYAITVHKSQGSQQKIIIVVLDTAAGPIGCREWLYTAISRASKGCFLIGKIETAMKMVGKVGLVKRKTFLKELLS